MVTTTGIGGSRKFLITCLARVLCFSFKEANALQCSRRFVSEGSFIGMVNFMSRLNGYTVVVVPYAHSKIPDTDVIAYRLHHDRL